MIRALLVDQLQHRKAHHLDPADGKGVVLQLRDAVFGVLLPAVLQQLFGTFARPAFLDPRRLDQAFQHFIFQRHISDPPSIQYFSITE